MPTIDSTLLADGQVADITQYNNLRHDILNGHNHSAGFGAQVSHGDLGDGIISGTYLSHGRINQHIQGSGTESEPDDPGGSLGVHGLHSSVYVMGSYPTQMTMQKGSGTTDNVTQIGSTDFYDRYEDITFPTPFDSAPVVMVTCNDSDSARTGVTNVTTAGFRALLGFQTGSKSEGGDWGAAFHWFAVGAVS